MENSASPLMSGRWVSRYARGLTAVGVFVFVVGVIYGVVGYFEWVGRPREWFLTAMLLVTYVSVCLKGFLAIGLASFLTYALGTRQQPGRIIRITEKVLYVSAGLGVLGFIFSSCFTFHYAGESTTRTALRLGLYGVGSMASALIWVALGLVLRRVLPVIEESRTLV